MKSNNLKKEFIVQVEPVIILKQNAEASDN